MAEEVGVEYGRAMAAAHGRREPTASARSAPRSHAVADALTAHGFAAHAEKHAATSCASCPSTARSATPRIEHPVICAVDRGMVQGHARRLYGDTAPEHPASLPQGDDVCVTAF